VGNLRCAICGDKTPADQEHICWVRVKLQEPVLHEVCTKCGEVEENSFKHWRCADRDPYREVGMDQPGLR